MKLFFKRCRIELITILSLSVIGVLFIIFNKNTLINLISYLLGIFFIAIGLLILVASIKNKEKEEPNLLFLLSQGIGVMVLGICIIVFKSYYLRLIIGFLVLIIAITRLILSKNRKTQVIKEAPKIAIGLFLVLSLDQFVKILFLCLGVLLIVFGGVLLFLTIKSYHQNKHNSFFYRIFTKTILRL